MQRTDRPRGGDHNKRSTRLRRFAALSLALFSCAAYAIPPNTPITNTASGQYRVAGVDYVVSDSATVITDAGAGNSAPSGVTLVPDTVVENDAGAVIGTLVAIDSDPGDSHTFALSDPRFEVVAGELKLIAGIALDYEIEPTVTIDVTVTDAAGAAITVAVVVTVIDVPDNAGAIMRLLRYAPGSSMAVSTFVDRAQCAAADVNVNDLDGNPLVIPGNLDLAGAPAYKTGEPVFIEVTDADANVDPAAIDVVDIVITAGTDTETVTARETGVDSGVFIAYLQSDGMAAVSGDCVIATDTDMLLTATYTDPTDPTDVAQASVLVDPEGRVFSSSNGQPVNGAVITLLDDATNQPASVRGDFPFAAFPATIASGGQVVDSAGVSYDFEPGEYRFPLVAPGDYRLAVVPPNRFRFPSIVTDSVLQALPGAPYALNAGSRGLVFNVAVGPALSIDIPLDLLPVTPSASGLTLLSYAPGHPNAQPTQVGATQCGATPAPPATDVDGSPLGVLGILELVATARFARGEPIFVQLIDTDQDLDAFAPDSVDVAVSIGGGDAETLTLTETGASTGIFIGYLQTEAAPGAVGDCLLGGNAGDAFAAQYQDALDPADVSIAAGQLDPGFIVFSSLSGDLLDGAEVTILDDATGLPAQVFGQDGVSSFPASVTSGGTASDSSGATYDFATGSIRFPVIPPGRYRLTVVAPTQYRFPSTTTDTQIAALPNGPFVMAVGSRGEAFDVMGDGSVSFDVPLDPIAGDVFVSKQASKDVAAIGDFVQYKVLVQNGVGQGSVTNLMVIDRLPVGFRYVAGSAKVDGVTVADPAVGTDGRDLSFPIAALGADSAVDVRYVTEITSGASLGQARNAAFVTGPSVASSNTAFAIVRVREDLLTSSSIIVGQVFEGDCGEVLSGFEGARVFMEDGSYVITDEFGKFHFEGVEPGTHVVQLDEGSLPMSHEIAACEAGTRFDDRGISQFVELAAGTMWRANFVVRERAPERKLVASRLTSRANNGRIRYDFWLSAGASRGPALLKSGDTSAGDLTIEDMTSVIMLPDSVRYVPGSAFLDRRAIDDPEGFEQGTLTLRLGNRSDAFAHRFRFEVAVLDETSTVTVRAITMFHVADEKLRTPVVANTLDLDAPVNLEALAGRFLGVRADDMRRRLANAAGTVDPGIESGAYTPELGSHTADSGIEVVEVIRAYRAEPRMPIEIPDLPDAATPEFDRAWIAKHATRGTPREIVWPEPGFNPRIPSIGTVVKHRAGDRVHVLLNGVLVNPMTFEGTVTDHKRDVAVSRWKNVRVEEGDNRFEVRVMDDAGQQVETLVRDVHYASNPVRAEFAPELSHLVADGMTSPVVAVRFYDRDGHPARPGVSGEFLVAAPHRFYDEATAKNPLFKAGKQGYERYLIVRDGVAYIRLQPTLERAEVVMDFKFDEHRAKTIRVRLTPVARDWILVGFGQGTAGYNTLSGNMRAAADTDLDDGVYTDGRVAFYAKGQIEGDWLLTLAYDSDKRRPEGLRRQIEPNRFYTLYGDGGEQRYAAESREKLYVRLERAEYLALFGDFDTGLDRTEFSRYTRTMNGMKADYYGEAWDASVFVAETSQAFVRDELRGDGTSGVYRLSRQDVLRNSERVTLVTRDRLKTEVVVESVSLSRHIDYAIDYDAGTLIPSSRS